MGGQPQLEKKCCQQSLFKLVTIADVCNDRAGVLVVHAGVALLWQPGTRPSQVKSWRIAAHSFYDIAIFILDVAVGVGQVGKLHEWLVLGLLIA